MANEQQFTIVGNLTADPELRFTQNGAAVTTFTVASTPRTYDRNTNEWVDGPPLFIECQAWRHLAENIGASLSKGMRVIAHGNMGMQHWQDKQTGQNRSKSFLDVQAVGPDLRYTQAQVQRNKQTQQGNSSWQGQNNAQQPAQQANNSGWGNQPQNKQRTAQQDAWNSQPQGGGFGEDDEPPF